MTRRATKGDIHRLCCDMLLDGKNDWIVRRKETAELLSEGLLRHKLSLDFFVGSLPATDVPNSVGMAFVPMTLLRKEPGTFTCFDLVDESGRSLPLPDRNRNADLSAGVLTEAAQRVLGHVSAGLRAELRLIARTNKDDAVAIVRAAYESPEGPVAADADAVNRRRLWEHDRFQWLLRTLARSSVVVPHVELDGRPRRVLKLSYDEKITDVTLVGEQPQLRLKLRALANRFGWRGYVLTVFSPFVGASSYHFELHAPEGAQILTAGLAEMQQSERPDPRRVHLYLHDARAARSTVAWAQMRIRGPGFVGPAAITAVIITGALAVAAWRTPQLRDAATSAPALLLLFPGLVGTYLARPTHPLVNRLLNLARWTLALCTFLAFAAAGRMALVSAQHPTSETGLRWFFIGAAVVSAVCAVALAASCVLPRKLTASPAPDAEPS
jgi:hypothetical protein